VVKNTKIFQIGLIVTGNLPRQKNFGGGEKCEDFSKWFHCNGQKTQMEDFEGGEKCKDFSKNGFIVMGNRPK
jgi:hypothetical protein